MKQITITISDPETEHAERVRTSMEADARRRENELRKAEREKALEDFFARMRSNNERA